MVTFASVLKCTTSYGLSASISRWLAGWKPEGHLACNPFCFKTLWPYWTKRKLAYPGEPGECPLSGVWFLVEVLRMHFWIHLKSAHSFCLLLDACSNIYTSEHIWGYMQLTHCINYFLTYLVNTYYVDELIRQVTINCAERGLLLLRVRDEIRMTIAAYQTLYESSVAFGMRKALQAEQGKTDMKNQVRRGTWR